jgi:hypothetical protein
MFLLVLDVVPCGIDIRCANGESSVSFLPSRPLAILPKPAGGISLQLLHGFGSGDDRRDAKAGRATGLRGVRAKSRNNLDVAFEFVIVAEVDDVVTAVAATPLTTQTLGMDRKQKRFPFDQHVRIVNRGLDRIHWEI